MIKFKNIFGFKFGRDEEENLPSIAPPTDDGAVNLPAIASFFSTTIDFDATAKNDVELIQKYRQMSGQPEIEEAINDIINEFVVYDEGGDCVKINLDRLDIPDNIKDVITDEFDNIKTLLNLNNTAFDLVYRWYVDGRISFHVIIQEENPGLGIQELRYIDPIKLKKVREIKKKKDKDTNADLITVENEYYIYNDKVAETQSGSNYNAGVKISTDSIIFVPSGLMDPKRKFILGWLHKCIRPLNILRMIEDAVILFKVSRAPSRRIFYIDVENLPKAKADQYVRDVATKYKNKVTYNAQNGSIVDDRHVMSMFEDYYIPRRNANKATEITTLDSADNGFTDMTMVEYFQKALYKACNVPITRLLPDNSFNLGKSNEITRDEIKFAKFINRLRNKFSDIFNQALKVQLVLKGICTLEEWDEFKNHISYDYISDNNYAELKDAELLRDRLGLLMTIDQYVGVYYSQDWVQKNILRMDDEEIKQQQQQIAIEQELNLQKQARQIELQNKYGIEPNPNEQNV